MGAASSPPKQESGSDRPAAGRIREARANDISVLIAAKEIFTERGWSAPMSAVAERAGVGIGSLYRRYPSKEALGQALRVAAMDEIGEIANACIEDVQAPRVLETFFDQYLESRLSPLVSVLGGHLPHPSDVMSAANRMHDSLQALVDIGHACQQVPRDYGPTDLLVIMLQLRGATPHTNATVTRFNKRLLEPLLTGLRVMASTERPSRDSESAIQWDEWIAYWSGTHPEDAS